MVISLLVFLITYPKNSGRVVFLAFAKVFDKLSPNKTSFINQKNTVLLGMLCRGVQNYLTNRSQKKT